MDIDTNLVKLITFLIRTLRICSKKKPQCLRPRPLNMRDLAAFLGALLMKARLKSHRCKRARDIAYKSSWYRRAILRAGLSCFSRRFLFILFLRNLARGRPLHFADREGGSRRDPALEGAACAWTWGFLLPICYYIARDRANSRSLSPSGGAPSCTLARYPETSV